MSNDWNKTVLTAIVAPANRYRFEGQTQFGKLLKLSDGKTETNYNADFHEYTQHAAPDSAPLELKGMIFQEQFGLYQAIQLMKNLSRALTTVLSPSYLPDEVLSIGDKQVSCYVIQGKARYRGGAADSISEMTFWIDKKTLAVRKQRYYEEGPIFSGNPQLFTQNRVMLYSVMQTDGTAFADALFAFSPPSNAQLVKELSDPRQRKDTLAGKPAPAIRLRDANGKTIALQDPRGKPLLLDFWATWCAPCVAAVEPMKRLHKEAAEKGLTIFSIDEDDNADTARDFLIKHQVPWYNIHDDGELWRAFPGNNGVPFYVLIDQQGRVVFSRSGAKDSELRAAIAKLGIDIPAGEALTTVPSAGAK